VCSCSEPGSAGGLVVDTDLLRKRIGGLVHPKCKTFLALATTLSDSKWPSHIWSEERRFFESAVMKITAQCDSRTVPLRMAMRAAAPKFGTAARAN
jgi:hypothetical protein